MLVCVCEVCESVCARVCVFAVSERELCGGGQLLHDWNWNLSCCGRPQLFCTSYLTLTTLNLTLPRLALACCTLPTTLLNSYLQTWRLLHEYHYQLLVYPSQTVNKIQISLIPTSATQALITFPQKSTSNHLPTPLASRYRKSHPPSDFGCRHRSRIESFSSTSSRPTSQSPPRAPFGRENNFDLVTNLFDQIFGPRGTSARRPLPSNPFKTVCV